MRLLGFENENENMMTKRREKRNVRERTMEIKESLVRQR